MDCRPCSTKRSPAVPAARRLPRFLAGLLLLGIATVGNGCSWLTGSQLKQYQAENQRLIDDYRLQRDRSAQLERENQSLEGRVTELENRLSAAADSAGGSGSARISGSRVADRPPEVPQTSPPAAADPPRSLPTRSIDPWRARL